MSKHTPILFSTPMVQAILDDRKTMTRRVVKSRSYIADVVDGIPHEMTEDDLQPIRCPYGQPGDILWVKETFTLTQFGKPVYRADAKDQSGLRWSSILPGDPNKEVKWKSPLFMPKAACRIFLRLTDIRVDRLGDITEEDAIAEGIERVPVAPFIVRYKDYSGKTEYVDSAIESFRTLWQSIHGDWNPDTWVWVVSFERVEKPENF